MASLRPAPDGYPIKLVRDRTRDILNASGEPGDLFYGPARGDLIRWLRLKLAEEVGEFLVDGGYDELRDVLAVVEGLAVAVGSSLNELVAALRDDPRGGFVYGVMMYGHHREFDGRPEADMGRG